MASGKEWLYKSVQGRTILNYSYSIGAAVVIAGALFKLMHWPGAGLMLIIGMGTECLVFLVTAFEPQSIDKEYHWERVYPVLELSAAKKGNEKSLTQQLDQALSDAKFGPELINSLGGSLKNLADSTGKLNDLTDASVAAKGFADSAKSASGTINSFAQAAAAATGSVGKIADGAENTKVYYEQVGTMVKNLSQLNAIYELELQDSNNHLKAMNRFFGNLSSAAEALSGTADDAVKYKDELGKLNKNLASLNSVYGNMLSAMKAS